MLFALVNTHEVAVDFVADTVDTSMIVVIVVSAIVGFGVGWLLAAHRGEPQQLASLGRRRELGRRGWRGHDRGPRPARVKTRAST